MDLSKQVSALQLQFRNVVQPQNISWWETNSSLTPYSLEGVLRGSVTGRGPPLLSTCEHSHRLWELVFWLLAAQANAFEYPEEGLLSSRRLCEAFPSQRLCVTSGNLHHHHKEVGGALWPGMKASSKSETSLHGLSFRGHTGSFVSPSWE